HTSTRSRSRSSRCASAGTRTRPRTSSRAAGAISTGCRRGSTTLRDLRRATGHLAGVTDDARRILEAALRLPDRERLKIAHELWESVPDADDEEPSPDEIERRIRDLDEGRVKPIPFDEVLAEARARLSTNKPKS